MENIPQYGPTNPLPVYPSPPSARTLDSDNHPQSTHWLAQPKQPSASTQPSQQPDSVYSVVDRTPDNDAYASPTPYTPDHPYPAYPQSPSIRNDENMHPAMSMPPQIPPSIGPARVTRRQARAQSALHLGIRRDRPQSVTHNENDEQPTYFMSPASALSRPQTPVNGPEPARYQQPADRTSTYSLQSSGGSMPLPSPRYLPTPVSGSPYSPFSLYPTHSRSASSYSTSNPRSASPALSVASALTSISSATSTAPNSQTFAAYPLPSPPVGPVVPRAKQRKQRLFNVDRKAICLYHQENPNARQEDIAARYGVERSTISKILKHKTKWMNVPEDDDMRVAKHRPSKFPEVEEELVNWLVSMKQQNTLLTDALIRNKAKETARSLQIPDERFKASSGWVENFKHRHNIRKGVWLGASKTLRAARGVGATHLRKGSNESVLSPLNPAFESSRSEALARRDSVNTADDGENDMESEDDQDLDPPDDNQPVAGPSHSHGDASVPHSNPLPPIWTMHPAPLSTANTPISSHPSTSQHNVIPQPSFAPPPPPPPQEERHHDPVADVHHQSSLQLTTPQHIPVSQPPQEVSLSAHGDTTTTYTDSVVVYQTAPPITTGNTIPDITEAEEAINKVILFVDSQSPSLLTPEERDALTQIKFALFQAASGVPFVRDRR